MENNTVTNESTDLNSKEESSSSFAWFRRKHLYEFEVVLFGKKNAPLQFETSNAIFAKAFALVLGNRNFAWNLGLDLGIETITTNTVFVGSAFICLCLCMGEMTSALPFSGGIFGFVRAATGPYYGFIVACFETVFCFTYLIVMMYIFLFIPVLTGAVKESYTPQLIGITYGFVLFMNLLGGKPFWTLTAIAGFTTFLLLFIFLCGTLHDVNSSEIDYKTFCETDLPVTFKSMMKQRWLAVSQFQGLQYLPLLSEYVKDPRKSIPRAMVLCSSKFVAFTIFISLAACSTAPGQFILQLVLTPLMFGFQRIFNTTLENGMWLHLPGLFAPILTVLFCSGRQLYMIAKSGFLPPIFAKRMPVTHTPMVTLTLSACIGAGINLYIYYRPEVWNHIVNIFVLSSHVVFVNAFIAYLFFRQKYSSMPRSFTSPVGVWGAWYGLANNVIGCISVVLYSDSERSSDSVYSLYLLLGLFVLATIFYWGYLVKRQKFSEEEKKLLFKAYLINANREKRNRILRNNKVCPANKSNPRNSITNKGKSTSQIATSSGESKRIPSIDDNPGTASNTPPQRSSPNFIRMAEEAEHHTDSSYRHDSMAASVLHYISGKFNAVAPLVETRLGSMTHDELHEYQQLAVLSAGGMLEGSEEVALEERFGLNDIEAAHHDTIIGNNTNDNAALNNLDPTSIQA